jgi:hypothetical protein
MPPLNPKITREQVRDALSRSGYLLESRMEALLRSKGYYVEANVAYPDADTGKSREVDIYAMQARKVGPLDLDFAFAVLVIECVNNPQPIAFITKEPQTSFLHYEEVKLAGLPIKIEVPGQRGSWQSLPYFLGMGRYHHYCKGRVATQFCSFVMKKNTADWMATHEESHFDSLKNLCSVADYLVDSHFKSWVFNGRENVNVEFYYPIVVVRGDLLEIRPGRKSPRILNVDHVQFRRSSIVRGEERNYQIDVLTESHLPAYLRTVAGELKRTAALLSRRHKLVRRSVDRIVKGARRLRSPEKIRAALEV